MGIILRGMIMVQGRDLEFNINNIGVGVVHMERGDVIITDIKDRSDDVKN